MVLGRPLLLRLLWLRIDPDPIGQLMHDTRQVRAILHEGKTAQGDSEDEDFASLLVPSQQPGRAWFGLRWKM